MTPAGFTIIQAGQEGGKVVEGGGGFKAQSVAKVPTSITGPNADASVSAMFSVNERTLQRGKPVMGSVTVSGTGFNDAPPTFKVQSLKIYEKGSNKLAAEIKNPTMSRTQTVWGEKKQTYNFSVPPGPDDRPALSSGKMYTVVAEVGINGAKPQQVRSEYAPVSPL
jgi:hypothetical protein